MIRGVLVMYKRSADFRFYGELNDFLPKKRRDRRFTHFFNGTPSVKDAVENLGVPHPEIDLIVVNGRSVGFDYLLGRGDHVSVYPVFEGPDISPSMRLRPSPRGKIAFVLDVHLGKLARRLRVLGFDTLYRNDLDDPEIIRISLSEKRVILTRDLGILKTRAVVLGYWVRATDPEAQVVEVVSRFDLRGQIRPLSRCTLCNGALVPIEKHRILHRLPRKTALYYDAFHICGDCEKLYWKGAHYPRLLRFIRNLGRGD